VVSSNGLVIPLDYNTLAADEMAQRHRCLYRPDGIT
jgi:hypothetical protein